MWKDVGRLFLLAVVLDIIYHVIALHGFYPVQTMIVATALAIVPYLMVRGVANRLVSQMRLAKLKESVKDQG
jgi:hypothetical protein